MRGWANSALLVLLAAIPAGAQTCSLRGTVVDRASGKAIAKARVFAAGSSAFLRTSNERGDFCFENLDAGMYQVAAEKTGYLRAWNNGKPGSVQGQPVNVAVVRSVTLRIEMTARAILAGTVVDRNSEPIPDVEVEVFIRSKRDPDDETVLDTTQTDDRGRFRFANLPPGSYGLMATMAEDESNGTLRDAEGRLVTVRPVATYYPGVADSAGAKPIVLEVGRDVTDLLLPLAEEAVAERTISGKIVPATEGSLQVSGRESRGRSESRTYGISMDGSFRVSGLPAGHYALAFSGSGLEARTDVDVTSGDVAGVVLAAHPVQSFNLQLIVRTEGGGAPFAPNQPMWIALAKDGHWAPIHGPLNDGSYEFRGLQPGVYSLTLPSSGHEGYFLKQVRFAGRAVEREIDLRGGAPGPVEVTFSSNVARLRGHVAGTAKGLVHVVLFRDGPGDPAWVGETTADQNGDFELKSLAPGKFRVVAIEDSDDWDDRAPDVKNGVVVELVEGEPKDIDVPLTIVP